MIDLIEKNITIKRMGVGLSMTEIAKNARKVERGAAIFTKGMPMDKIAVIAKGNGMISDDYIQIPISQGDLVGILDIASEEYLYNYIATEDSVVCYFDYKDIADIGILGTVKSDYRDFIIQTDCEQMEEMIDVHETLDGVTRKLFEYIKKYYDDYVSLCKDYMKKPYVSKEIEELGFYNDDIAVDDGLIRYFQSLSVMPVSVRQPFFEEDDDITGYNILLGSRLACQLCKANAVMFSFYNGTFKYLYDKGINNIFAMFSKLAMDVVDAGGDISKIRQVLDKVICLIKECKDLVEDTLGLEFQYDFTRISDICKVIDEKDGKNSGSTEEVEKKDMLLTYTEAQINEAITETKDSLKRILQFSRIEPEKADKFEKFITVYRGLKDPYSTEDDVRKLRARITDLFYDIYERVFFNAEATNTHIKIIDMFLNFGFVDETMIEQDKLVDLYYLDTSAWEGKVNVYPLRQWLHAIYTGKKEPSKNEFDLDYNENLRELKKTQRMTQEEEQAYLNDMKGRVRFELQNMIKTNNRITNGQMLTFCPLLKDSDFIVDVKKMYVTGEKAQEALLSVTEVDFSAFYREYLYEDVEHKISRLSLEKEVLPDIILMPNAGHKGSMWQDISGKRRDTAGRFVMSAFTIEDVRDLMIKMVGAFRWELCRTVQGTYWNDVREKSLTSEYCDYVQFYKKNRELSEEVKEKIKAQLQKARNNTREMFVKDYEVWVKNECMGMSRVNKVVRSILFAYCPFSKQYRDKINEQPMFRDGLAKYERERLKKIKSLNGHFAAIKNSGGEITPLLQENMDYLKEQ